MIIYCDMDGVLAQFTARVVEILGQNGIPAPSRMTKWKLEDNVHPLWRKKAKKIINDALHYPEFWSLLWPLEGAIEGFKKLQTYGDVYIATTPWNSSACFKGKRKWVGKWLPWFDQQNVIYIKNKSLLRGDLLIDDKPSNLDNFHGDTIIFDREWNEKHQGHVRAQDWNDLLEIMSFRYEPA